MVFIVGQTEQASEKAKLLQQLGQVFLFYINFKSIKSICFSLHSFLLNKNKISVVQNLMIMMIQVKHMMKLKQLLNHSMSKIVIFMLKH